MPWNIIWNSMSNWRLYSFQNDQINRQVGSPWKEFFIETFSKSAHYLNSKPEWVIERISVPAFYFHQTRQQGSIEIISRHAVSKEIKSSTHHLQTNVQYGDVYCREFHDLNINTTAGIIYAIIPLSGRADTLHTFIVRWMEAKMEKLLHLTFSVMDLNETSNQNVAQQLGMLKRQYPDSVEFIISTRQFSRGVALQKAIELRDLNDVLFLCDIDMVFGASLIQRIRSLTTGGVAYYPIFLSNYQFGKDGFWRTFSYGMLSIIKRKFDLTYIIIILIYINYIILLYVANIFTILLVICQVSVAQLVSAFDC